MSKSISIFFVAMAMTCLGFNAINAQNNRNGYPTILHQPPEADFGWVNACYGDTTQFTNGSIRGITYKWWIFDKNMNKLDSFTTLNISYLFPSADTFYVELDADNGHPATITQMIIIDSATTADFSFMHCSNQFLNHATCATSFFWNFGDGNTSTLAIPTHQYADTGYYNVTFIASKGGISDTITKQIFVDPQAFPTGVTTYTLSHDTVFVHAVDSMAGMFYNWNFGMGVHMYKRDTFYVLPDTGTYIINFGDWNTCSTMYSYDTVRYYTTISGMSKTNTLSSISLFPNPCANYLYLAGFPSCLRNKKPVIFNILNQRISEDCYQIVQMPDGYRIELQKITGGAYYIRIFGEETSFTSKIIVAKE